MQSLQNDTDDVDTHDQLIMFLIIIFSHGLALHFHLYGGDLHSHGYIVSAVECKDGSSILALK